MTFNQPTHLVLEIDRAHLPFWQRGRVKDPTPTIPTGPGARRRPGVGGGLWRRRRGLEVLPVGARGLEGVAVPFLGAWGVSRSKTNIYMEMPPSSPFHIAPPPHPRKQNKTKQSGRLTHASLRSLPRISCGIRFSPGEGGGRGRPSASAATTLVAVCFVCV